ncbi:MAG: hypothetical protein ACRD2Z_11850, partial [Thermoanaerobaculia bacterium]
MPTQGSTALGIGSTGDAPAYQAQRSSDAAPAQHSTASGIEPAGGAVDSLAQSASGSQTNDLPAGQGSLGKGVAVPTGAAATPATIRDGQVGSQSGAAAQPRGADVAAQQSAATAKGAA